MLTGSLLQFATYRKYSHCFIETGTACMDGVFKAFAAGFTHVKSVEACDTYYDQNESKILALGWRQMGVGPFHKRFGKDSLVLDLYKGMSQDRLGPMLNDIKSPVVFWLDAHCSGPASAGHTDYLEKGSASSYAQDTVLTRELQLITKHRPDHIILIDDQNGPSAENARYIKYLLNINPLYRFSFYDEVRGDDYYANKCLVCESH